MNRFVGALALSLFALPAAAQDKASIQKLNDAFVAAFARGDADTVAGLYAEDASVLPAGAAMVKGRDGIRAFWAETMKSFASAGVTTQDVQPLGPAHAQEIGTFSLVTRSQPPQTVSGKYVVIWRKVGNDWKLATDIWNMDK